MDRWMTGAPGRAARSTGVWLCLGLGLGLAGLPTARAETDLRTVGVWTAFKGQTSTNIAICGLKTGFPDSRAIYIKWYQPDDYLVVQTYKESWDIPAQLTVKIKLTFPNSEPWTATYTSDTAGHIIEFQIPKEKVKEFVRDFTSASTAVYTFPGGSEPAWNLNLSGSAGALDVMAQCIDNTGGPSSTTPLAFLRRGPPAQPVGQPAAPPRPTQPF